MNIERTTARVIAMARDSQGLTAAEMDYQVAVGGVGRGFGDPIQSAIYGVANEHLPPIQPGCGDAELERRVANSHRLRDQLDPALERYVRRCRHRRYVGWATGGPVRYADEPGFREAR
jgi:hypothetical protein